MGEQERKVRQTVEKQRVLISGASFAGLSTAYWMNRLGYAVTVVEIGKGLKMGGTPVNIENETIEIVRRMGLLERIQKASLPRRSVEFLAGDGESVVVKPADGAEDGKAPEYEIERDDLLQIQFEAVTDEVEFVFGDSIAHLEETENEVQVFFKSGMERSYALVYGCDGNHSAVRRMCFGEEAGYSVFLKRYFSITIVNKLLIDEDTTQLYNVAGKAVMLNGYHGKTDIGLIFYTEQEIPYDYRDRDQQRRMMLKHFEGGGWRLPALLEEVRRSENFYFDKLVQIRMPSWTKGRVALVGDAAYCASPAAGMGGSLAIIGAGALGDAFAKHPDDFHAAFAEYNVSLRPLIDRVQQETVEQSLEMFAPSTEESLRARNDRLRAG